MPPAGNPPPRVSFWWGGGQAMPQGNKSAYTDKGWEAGRKSGKA